MRWTACILAAAALLAGAAPLAQSAPKPAGAPPAARDDDQRAAEAAFERFISTRRALLSGWRSGEPAYRGVEHAVTQAAEARDPLIRELYRRMAEDQITRLALGPVSGRTFAGGLSAEALNRMERMVGREMAPIDRENTAWMKARLQEFDWFRVSRFGEAADRAAWLLVQHADEDRALQKLVLGRLEPLVALKETSPANYAYLYDRVAGGENRPQRYGTQGRCVGPGRWEPKEVEAPEGLEERRKAVGLGTMAEYKGRFEDICRQAD